MLSVAAAVFDATVFTPHMTLYSVAILVYRGMLWGPFVISYRSLLVCVPALLSLLSIIA